MQPKALQDTNTAFTICAYATEDTPYTAIAEDKLLASCKAIDVPVDYHIVPNLHSWKANTSYKATFAKEMLARHKTNVVLLDVDCKVMEAPVLFNYIPVENDVAAHILNHRTWYRNSIDKLELLSGTLFLRNNNTVKEMVNEWERRCQADINVWEQQILHKVILDNKIKVFELPMSYCYINEVMTGVQPYVKCDNPVIVHYQESRKTKRYIC